jgi:hypothetical protein
MSSLIDRLPRPADFDADVQQAKKHLDLAVAYAVAHHKLACADVVVRAAVAFCDASDAEDSSTALENLFDAVDAFRREMKSLDAEGTFDA